MTRDAAENSPTVVLRVADEALRRRLDELLQKRVADAIDVAVIVEANGAADCLIPAAGDDDLLGVVAELATKLAVARRQLAAARRNEDGLLQLAATDPLTGLANRRAWDDALDRAGRHSAARGDPLCVALVDLDEFKRVNDVNGHAVGDAVLRATAEGLRSAVRRDDLAARLGGDEFGLLLPGLSPDHAAAVIERIRSSVHAAIAEARLPPTTSSVGYATGIKQPYARASAALQVAKQSGRNRSSAAP